MGAPNNFGGRRKVPTMSLVLVSVRNICFRKTSGSNMEAPHKLCSFTSSLCTCPASSASTVYRVFFRHIVWYGPSSETARMQRKQKKWLNNTEFAELNKINGRIYSNCSNCGSLFLKSLKFCCCSFYFIQKKLQLTVQVCCLFYFLLHSTLAKEKLWVRFRVLLFKLAIQNGWLFC